jgi:hypothetical protein
LFFQVRLGFLKLCLSCHAELTFGAQVIANGSEVFERRSGLPEFRLCRCLLLTLGSELLLQAIQLLILCLSLLASVCLVRRSDVAASATRRFPSTRASSDFDFTFAHNHPTRAPRPSPTSRIKIVSISYVRSALVWMYQAVVANTRINTSFVF